MAKGKGSDIEMMPLAQGRKTIWHLQKMKDEGKLISMSASPIWILSSP